MYFTHQKVRRKVRVTALKASLGSQQLMHISIPCEISQHYLLSQSESVPVNEHIQSLGSDLVFLLPSGKATSKLPQQMYSYSSLNDYVMSLTIKKFILISNIDKHQVKHISIPAVFCGNIQLLFILRDFYRKKILVSANGLNQQDVLKTQ